MILSLRLVGPVIAKSATNREVLRASSRPLIRLRLGALSSAQVWRFVSEYLILVGAFCERRERGSACARGITRVIVTFYDLPLHRQTRPY